MARGFDSILVEAKLGSNRKFRRLAPAERWCAVAGVWAIAAQSPIRGSLLIAKDVAACEDDYASEAGVSVAVARSTVTKMRELGMLELDEDGVEVVHDWDQHQVEPRPSETPEARRLRKREERERRRAEGESRDSHDDVTRDTGLFVSTGHAGVTPPKEKEKEKRKETQLTSSLESRRDLLDLSNRLADGIRANDQKARVKPTSNAWLEPLRLLIDRDGRSTEEVADVIDWVLADDFEHKVVLSPGKLRERFTELALKAGVAERTPHPFEFRLGKRTATLGPRAVTAPSIDDVWLAENPSTPSLEADWAPVREQLLELVGKGTFGSWLAPLHAHATGDELVLGCPPKSASWVHSRFGSLLESRAGKPVRIVECSCQEQQAA